MPENNTVSLARLVLVFVVIVVMYLKPCPPIHPTEGAGGQAFIFRLVVVHCVIAETGFYHDRDFSFPSPGFTLSSSSFW